MQRPTLFRTGDDDDGLPPASGRVLAVARSSKTIANNKPLIRFERKPRHLCRRIVEAASNLLLITMDRVVAPNLNSIDVSA